MTLSVAKLGSSYDVDFLLCMGLEIRVTNVSCPDFHVVQLSKEHDQTKPFE